MYFGLPMPARFPSPVAARGMPPAQRFVPAQRGMPPRYMAPQPQRIAPVQSAWRMIGAQQRQQQRDEAIRAEIRRTAAQRGITSEAQARVLFQQMVTAQAAAQAAQATAPAVAIPTPPTPTTAPQISPGSPEADLRPTQDAAEDAKASSAAQPEAPPKDHKKILLIGLAVVAVGGVGYFVMRKKKTKSS